MQRVNTMCKHVQTVQIHQMLRKIHDDRGGPFPSQPPQLMCRCLLLSRTVTKPVTKCLSKLRDRRKPLTPSKESPSPLSYLIFLIIPICFHF